MYDDETIYFQPQRPEVNPSFFYGGYGIGSPTYSSTYQPQNPFAQDSRRYDYGTQPGTYTPSCPQQPQYPGFNNNGYYGNGYPQGPADSRRNDTVGLLNSDLFHQQQQNYSRPMEQYQTPLQQRQLPTQSYNGARPVNGFNNMYTQPRLPENPNIDWGSVGDKSPDYGYATTNYSNGYTGTFATKEDDWVAIVNKNFAAQL